MTRAFAGLGQPSFDLAAPMYHGTRHAHLTKLQPSTGGEFGPGIYLTSFRPTAEFYAQHVARGPDAPTILTARADVQRPFVVRKVDYVKMTERSTPRTVQKRLIKQGYDAIVGIAINDYEWQLVVFDPDKVTFAR